jgi:hypothetical protein
MAGRKLASTEKNSGGNKNLSPRGLRDKTKAGGRRLASLPSNDEFSLLSAS